MQVRIEVSYTLAAASTSCIRTTITHEGGGVPHPPPKRDKSRYRPYYYYTRAPSHPCPTTVAADPGQEERHPAPVVPSACPEPDAALGALPSNCPLQRLVRKPRGEMGKPGAGGYSLKEVLCWKDYFAVKNDVSDLVDEWLDPTKPLTQQDKESVNVVKQTAVGKYPRFRAYENMWPLLDLIRSRLKYTRSRGG